MWYTSLLEKNRIPDFLIRKEIRKLLGQRLSEEDKGSPEKNQESLMSLIQELESGPIAIETKAANEQHYEVPTEFYQLCLGKNLKYSSGYWSNSTLNLNASEDLMLDITVKRAEIKDEMHILELGCGWGSLTLFMAARFPNSKITGVSNSSTQREFILDQAKSRGLTNIEIITCDMNDFSIDKKFDRVVSVEMFEHMRNYRLLLRKVSGFLKPEGKLFVHIFTHKTLSYKFEVKDESDWMSRYFFTGGIMPSDHLLFYFADDFNPEKHWNVDGTHYARTSESWLKNLDRNKEKALEIFRKTYGEKDALKWFVYWRIFFMSCAELWNYDNGRQWMVSHYLFKKK